MSRGEPKRIAVFRMGHLGDTIVGLPALWTVRKLFPNAHIVYLTQAHQGGSKVTGLQVIRLGTVYDEEMAYDASNSFGSIVSALRELRRKQIDTLVYIPPYRTPKQRLRDTVFFRLAGVRRIIGMRGLAAMEYSPKGSPLPVTIHVTDRLLSHLADDGVRLDGDPTEWMDFGLSDEERAFGDGWLADHGVDRSRPIVGIGPGSKMPSKLWPVERFVEVADRLDREFHPTFVLFGSPDERSVCERISSRFPTAINAAGELAVRQSASVFERCSLYVGNDTGTMHIAAASKVRCVAVFSARDYRGRWYPYGPGHRVHREIVPCEGCMLEVCDKDNLCLKQIGVDAVVASAREILSESQEMSRI